jgi:oxalate decarboxylase/phosphoglucose isomerase-like protein (cupin superfamily)
MANLTNYNIGGDIIKDDETYQIIDNQQLNNLVLSQTRLHAHKQTRGHRHAGQEEIYFFVAGTGQMIVGNEDSDPFSVAAGDVVIIPDGAFHRVVNTHEIDLVFNCVFDGSRNH